MNIYIVSGRSMFGEYTEVVDVFEDMEEKPKSYVCVGTRIDKNKIGKVEESRFIGSYQIALVDSNEIAVARRTIKEKVRQYHQNEFDKTKIALDAIDRHSLNSDIKFRS
ncbi:hypothetical protein GCM10023310_70620 [Paenibacillus vulneris]|uniref:Uncharacterized protein n=1 Tax=Paenibacillus vulneris TaxID=1133364 RepID=A0ABW3UGG3_9BACL